MSYIIHIDTAISSASVCLAKNGEVISSGNNISQQDHAAWINNAIKTLLEEANITISDLSAVAVIEGPGSYTGLRVGMATAKGICYALNIPLITEGTLKVMAASALLSDQIYPDTLVAPMIDARRMEVFTAVFDINLSVVAPPSAMIVDDSSFSNFLSEKHVLFFGNGSMKWEKICTHANAKFALIEMNGNAFAKLSYQKFLQGEFATLAYAEPVYLKEFYIHPK